MNRLDSNILLEYIKKLETIAYEDNRLSEVTSVETIRVKTNLICEARN